MGMGIFTVYVVFIVNSCFYSTCVFQSCVYYRKSLDFLCTYFNSVQGFTVHVLCTVHARNSFTAHVFLQYMWVFITVSMQCFTVHTFLQYMYILYTTCSFLHCKYSLQYMHVIFFTCIFLVHVGLSYSLYVVFRVHAFFTLHKDFTLHTFLQSM